MGIKQDEETKALLRDVMRARRKDSADRKAEVTEEQVRSGNPLSVNKAYEEACERLLAHLQDRLKGRVLRRTVNTPGRDGKPIIPLAGVQIHPLTLRMNAQEREAIEGTVKEAIPHIDTLLRAEVRTCLHNIPLCVIGGRRKESDCAAPSALC